jgi:hypothetical protein
LRIVRRSERATLVALPIDNGRTVWLPRSVADAAGSTGLVDTLSLPLSWYAKVQQALEPELHRPAAASTPASVQATYTATTGVILRQHGRSRPSSMDELADVYGEAAPDAVMESNGAWIDLVPRDMTPRSLPALAPVTTAVRRLDPAAWGNKLPA